MEPLRIGVTSRIVQAEGYNEPRDALAQDWARFLAQHYPHALWQPLPNEGRSTVRRFEGWNLNALILSGGNDIGAEPLKDETDHALLEHALAHDLPVLGICRGLQVMQWFFGGPLSPANAREHVACDHAIEVLPAASWRARRTTVNSFHNVGIRAEDLAAPLQALALAEDDTVEAARIRNHPGVGVMWHPERADQLDDLTRQLISLALDAPHE